MKNVAVILARGGSKGIPRKNLIKINDKPLIYYTIKAAILSRVEETWVSTEDPEIKEISEHYGAKVLDRPEELADDSASSDAALVHFCQKVPADNVVFLQPTSPLVLSKDINQGLAMLDKYDSVFSGCREHWVPRWRSYESGSVSEYQWNRNQRPRRQDRSELIIENGAFYISPQELILKSKLRYSGKIGYYEMPMSRSIQLDDYQDLFIIETILRSGGENV